MASTVDILRNEVKRGDLMVGFTWEELGAAFSAVRDPADWKKPVDALVKDDNLAVTLLAVEFYTATKPKVLHRHDVETVHIFADGYRKGPAGDN